MVDIPQYESEVPIQPAPVVSSGPTWDAVSQTAKKMMGEVGSEIQRSEEIALQQNRYDSDAQIANGALNAYNSAIKNPDVQKGLAQFNSDMDGIAKGILAQTPKTNISYVKRLLVYQTDRYNQEFLRREAQQSQSLAYKKFISNYDIISNEMSNAAYRGDHPAAQSKLGVITNHINDAIKNGFLNASRAAVLQRSARAEFEDSIVLGQYRAAKTKGLDEAQKFRKRFIESKEYDPWFDIDAKRQKLRQFDDIDKQFAAEAGINSGTYDLFKQQLIYNAQNGRPIDKGILATMVSSFPDRAPVLLNDINNAKQQYQIISSVKNGTLSEIQSKINDLTNPAIMPADVNDAQNNLKAATYLTNYLKELKADPVQLLKQNAAYRDKIQESKTTGDFTPSQVSITSQKYLGFQDNQIHAIDNNTAMQAVEAIRALPLQQQVRAMDNFIDQHATSSRPYLIKDLQRNGLPLATQYLYRISKATDPTLQRFTTPAAIAWNNIDIKNGAANYKKAMQDYAAILETNKLTPKKLEVLITSDRTFGHYADVFTAQSGDVSKPLADYTNHAVLLASELMAEGESSSSAVSNANLAMTAGLAFDSYRGNAIAYDDSIDSALLYGHRIPFGIKGLFLPLSPGVLDYMLYKAEDGGVDIPDGYREMFPTLTPKALQKKFLSEAHFALLPDQSGLILQDANQIPVISATETDPTKDKFIVRWSDLKDHNSELMNEFTKQKSEWRFIKGGIQDLLSGLNPFNLGFMDAYDMHQLISTGGLLSPAVKKEVAEMGLEKFTKRKLEQVVTIGKIVKERGEME